MTKTAGRDVSTRSWGRTRHGRSPWPGAVAIGGAVSLALAAVAGLLSDGPRPWLYALLVGAMMLPAGIGLGWVLVVDRRSVTGAVARPEESVEGRWYDTAALGAFHDLIVVVGVAAAVVSFVPALRGVAASTVLTGLFAVALVDVSVRYAVLKRRGA